MLCCRLIRVVIFWGAVGQLTPEAQARGVGAAKLGSVRRGCGLVGRERGGGVKGGRERRRVKSLINRCIAIAICFQSAIQDLPSTCNVENETRIRAMAALIVGCFGCGNAVHLLITCTSCFMTI